MAINPGCDGKVAHKTILSAEYFLHEKSNNLSDEWYKCKICGFIHIGSSGAKIPIISGEKKRKQEKPNKVRKFKHYRRGKND